LLLQHREPDGKELMAEENWTETHVRALIAHARGRDPRWSWKLTVRPETAALLGLEPGLLQHPSPRYVPLEVATFDGCEVRVIDLVADFVLASPVDGYGLTPDDLSARSYWLNLRTGDVDVWTEHSLEVAKRAADG
jgi:hypothetical protein